MESRAAGREGSEVAVVAAARLRARVHAVLERGPEGGRGAFAFDAFILTLIGLNVTAVILETVQPLHAAYALQFRVFEGVSVAVFTLEYALRLWSAPEAARYAGRGGRARWAATPMAVIDLVAFLPAYLVFLVPIDLRFVRIVRLLRVFKLTRHSEALSVLGRVVRAKRAELFLAFSVLGIALVLASSIMYFLERDAQPEAFSSIPMAMWWGAVTLATVGYGDVYPVTVLGRTLGAVFVILGIAVFALPVAVIASGFTEELQRRAREETCVHCGKDPRG